MINAKMAKIRRIFVSVWGTGGFFCRSSNPEVTNITPYADIMSALAVTVTGVETTPGAAATASKDTAIHVILEKFLKCFMSNLDR